MEADLTLTDTAASRIRHLLADSGDGAVFRLSVLGGGCSGFQYDFSVADQATGDDLVIERNGARVAVDPISLPLVSARSSISSTS